MGEVGGFGFSRVTCQESLSEIPLISAHYTARQSGKSPYDSYSEHYSLQSHFPLGHDRSSLHSIGEPPTPSTSGYPGAPLIRSLKSHQALSQAA